MRREGYRYIRTYDTKHGMRWALWQVIQGRARRIGTAKTIHEEYAYLGISGPIPAAVLACFPPENGGTMEIPPRT